MDFHQTFVCALILWRSGFGLLMGKVRQCLTRVISMQHNSGGVLKFSCFYWWGKKESYLKDFTKKSIPLAGFALGYFFLSPPFSPI